MTDPAVTPELVARHGLSPEEYVRIEAILGRAPNFTELGIFSVMWSEHCSYKNSRPELKKFPTTGPRVLVKAGEENAGVLDIGGGWAVAFKMESHNHPSAIEPFQGAATGVGGILRDIFTMGARPVFSLNSLRFGDIHVADGRTEAGPKYFRGPSSRAKASSSRASGPSADAKVSPARTKGLPDDAKASSAHGKASSARASGPSFCASGPSVEAKNSPSSVSGPPAGANAAGNAPANVQRNRRLFAGVVAGIAHYGNCIGVPTVGGEVAFDESYEGNPLVNVFSLGILRHEQIARGAARGVGNPVFYVGAETGRDGLAGAAFASRDLTEESKQDRPAVQVGDPFKEKLLLEACLELLAIPGAVAGIQDMGAAGLTCSTCETASRGGTGVEIDLAKVPQREPGMTPYETLLSESQERMLIIANAGREAEVRAVFARWDLPCAEIGRVTDDGMMRVLNHGVVAAEIPARPLAEEAPVYHREARAPEGYPAAPLDLASVPEADPHAALLALLSHPTIASKNWVWRQYDHTVRAGGVVPPGSDAAVFLVREAGDRLLAATSDCNGLFCRLDPREGARHAVAEAARNLTCSGAVPLAVTDNLNFGNPYRPENFWYLRECVEGLAEACREFDTPVTGGNVSLYNESPAGVVDPTPTVGMVGLIEDPAHVTTQSFKAPGDVILLVGEPGGADDLGGSHYLKVVHGQKAGRPPRLDFGREKAVQAAVLALIRAGLVRSAHDCAEGGLAVAVAESCVSGEQRFGATLELGDLAETVRPDALLFNEAASRVVVSVTVANEEAARALLGERGVPARRLGVVGARDGELAVELPGGQVLRWGVGTLHDGWYHSIARCLAKS